MVSPSLISISSKTSAIVTIPTGFFLSSTTIAIWVRCFLKPVNKSEDIFLLKYDKNGNEIWGVDYGGTGRNAGRGITTDKNGSIFLTGSFDEKILKIEDHSITNIGDSDIFVVKFREDKK
jgi:hypothetical protein